MMRTTVCMLALLCGCAASLRPPVLPHGEATRRALAMQILDPEAGRSRQPVSGMDGRSAAGAQQRYQKSFSEAPQESTSAVSRK